MDAVACGKVPEIFVRSTRTGVPHWRLGRVGQWLLPVLDAVFGLDSKRIALAVDMLLRHASLTIQDSEVVAAALSHYRGHPKVGFSDCLILEVAKKAGHIPVGTFDREMAKLEGALRV